MFSTNGAHHAISNVEKIIHLSDEFSEISAVFGKVSCFSLCVPFKNKLRFVGCCYFVIRWNPNVGYKSLVITLPLLVFGAVKLHIISRENIGQAALNTVQNEIYVVSLAGRR